jgi:quercetin dioxygenase-like cupin family protein
MVALGRFEDHRGVIQDIVGRIDSVTRITTVAGAVRGNHYHRKTTQWTLVLSGTLQMATDEGTKVMRPGEIVKHGPGVPHAWRAIGGDAECLVFTKGPRSGEDYETDTYRLEEPLL